MMRYTKQQIFETLGINKIVRTRDLFCSCGGTRVRKLYKQIDSSTVLNIRTNLEEKLDIYTEIDIDYCPDCGRDDYICAEQGFKESFRAYFRNDKKFECPECGEKHNYTIIISTAQDGDFIFRCINCNVDIKADTNGQLFENGQEAVKWCYNVAIREENEEYNEFLKEQNNIYRDILNFAFMNDISVYQL